MIVDKVIAKEIFIRFNIKNPNPESDLIAPNDYTFCVAVLLSAQTTDKAVNKATKELFEEADTPEKMLQLGEEKLKTFIKSIGFYNTKSKNIILLSKLLIDQYNATIPNTRDDLEKLPGIGRKSASVILNRVFDVPSIAVDTHVLRVSNRLGLSNNKTPIEVEKDLLKIVPNEFHTNTSDWLVLHGRYICMAKKPNCAECFLNDICQKNRYVK
ncbi:MAG: endonuclease III [Holosporales bacterium]|jgi:endonuclease-3|nr:endonuclease III [Holosporales bacterium]